MGPMRSKNTTCSDGFEFRAASAVDSETSLSGAFANASCHYYYEINTAILAIKICRFAGIIGLTIAGTTCPYHYYSPFLITTVGFST